jgi:hypothetical protein
MPPQQLPDAVQVLLQVLELLALYGLGHRVSGIVRIRVAPCGRRP